MSANPRMARALAVGVVVAAVALLASGFVAGAAPDEEEFRFTVLTSWLHVRALLQGDYAFWTSQLGFGLPQPLIANYWFHPLLPLLAVLSPVAWMRVVLLVHTLAGAAGVWRLCRSLGVCPVVAAVATASFLLAAPAQNYLLTDFWPSPWMALTIIPWLLLLAWRVLEGAGGLGPAAALGLLTGLVVANDNPGSILIYSGLAAAVVVARARAAVTRWRELALAAAIALALVAPNIVLLARERAHFPADLAASSGPDPLPVSATARDAFLRPQGSRTLFFGAPFALLGLVACARGGWQRPELVAGLGIAAIQMFTAAPALGASDRYLFRDPIVLCAIPLAAMAAERGWRRTALRVPTAIVLAAQLASVTTAIVPPLQQAWDEGRQGAPHYRGGVGDGPVADALVDSVRGGRLLLSPLVDHQVRERGLLDAGLGVNALAYRDILSVNGWFKGVSANTIAPDERSFYARIRPPQPLVESAATLDVLGIRYLLADRDETVAPDLRNRRQLSTPRMALTLYENEDAWPGAFLVDADGAGGVFATFEGCEYDRLLCRDLSPLAARARHDGIQVTRGEGSIDIALGGARGPGVLVVTEMYRPEWTATGGGTALPVAPFAGALLRVDIPAGVSSVRLVYRPWLMMAATGAAWLAVIAACAVLVMAKR